MTTSAISVELVSVTQDTQLLGYAISTSATQERRHASLCPVALKFKQMHPSIYCLWTGCIPEQRWWVSQIMKYTLSSRMTNHGGSELFIIPRYQHQPSWYSQPLTIMNRGEPLLWTVVPYDKIWMNHYYHKWTIINHKRAIINNSEQQANHYHQQFHTHYQPSMNHCSGQ